jgi:N-acetylmuramic acid 6-phosphate etherase
MKRPTSPRVTERKNPASSSLDTLGARQILQLINREDRKVAVAVGRTIPRIAKAVDLIVRAIERGGRLIYLGAGSSGRLGVLDAAECPPTFGTQSVQAVIAGGEKALRQAAEGAEDDPSAAARDLRRLRLTRQDIVVGIAASGTTPYTLGGLRYARKIGAATIAVTCNPSSLLERLADVAIVPVVGPEILAGSTRMKAGTAQKLVLNMLSTAAMIRLGRVYDGMMIHVALTNQKLQKRGRGILMQATGMDDSAAERVLKVADYNLPVGMLMHWKGISKTEAQRMLREGKNPAAVLRAARKRSRE